MSPASPSAVANPPGGPVLAVLAALAVVELGLAAVALWRWWRTPAERLSANRWVWLVLVVALSFIGPVAFLAAGRRPAPVTEPPPGVRPAAGAGTADVVAALYGGDRR
mgnify:CR=1 FL=1